MRGCYFKVEGIKEPDKVKEYTLEVRRDYDIFSQFVEDGLKEDPDTLTPFADVYAHFNSWADSNNIKVSNIYTKTEIKKYVSDIFGREKVIKLKNEFKKGYNLILTGNGNELDDEETPL